jgi:hypothetical protein
MRSSIRLGTMASPLKPRVRLVLPIATAAALGVFLSVASHELDWNATTVWVVGLVLAAVVGLLGTPLLLLPTDALAEYAARKTERPQSEQSRESMGGIGLPIADRERVREQLQRDVAAALEDAVAKISAPSESYEAQVSAKGERREGVETEFKARVVEIALDDTWSRAGSNRGAQVIDLFAERRKSRGDNAAVVAQMTEDGETAKEHVAQ